MHNILKISIFLLVVTQTFGQQAKLSPVNLYKPYQRAQMYLSQAQQSLPSSPLINQELERIQSTLSTLSSEILTGENADQFAFFELQRLIDKIAYNESQDELQDNLKNLYAHVSKYQDKLIKNQAQLTKIAQCIMSLSPKTSLIKTERAKYKAQHVKELYNSIDTNDWDYTQNLSFIDVFVGQYARMGNIGMSVKLYRQFEDLLVNEKQTTSIETFSIPDQITYRNGRLNFTDINWNILNKNKIVITLEEENLYHLVYLVTTLRAYDEAYKSQYNIIVVCNKSKISDDFLKFVKQNLAFDDYFFAMVDQNWQENNPEMPIGLFVDKNNNVTYQTNHISKVFNKLNTPIEDEYIKNQTKRRRELAENKAALQQKAVKMADSIIYKEIYGNITFSLKGLWQDNLKTQLAPVEGQNTSDLPYLAIFEVFNDQYQVFQELILVTGEEQNIDIYSDYQYQKSLTYQDQDNARFHETIKAIDICLQEEQSYNYLYNIYPFQNSEFVERLGKLKDEAATHINLIINDLEDRKIKTLLEKYTAQKAEAYRSMM